MGIQISGGGSMVELEPNMNFEDFVKATEESENKSNENNKVDAENNDAENNGVTPEDIKNIDLSIDLEIKDDPIPDFKLPDQVPDFTKEKPKVDDFESYDDFLEALTDYKAELALHKYKQEQSSKEYDSKIKEIGNKKLEIYRSKIEDAKKIVGADNWNKLNDLNIQMSEVVQTSLLDINQGPLVFHYLATNPEQLSKIERLSLHDKISTINNLNAKFQEKVDKLTIAKKNANLSKAPDPANTSARTSAAQTKKQLWEADSYEEYLRLKEN